MRQLIAKPLNRKDFSPYGDVIEKSGSESFEINGGMATRFHDLAKVETELSGGRTLINIFEGRPWPLPLDVKLMERHRLGSQAFIPLRACVWLVVVAPAGEFDINAIEAFHADGSIGVNYRPGTWHHPLITLNSATDFLVVDRAGPMIDCDEVELDGQVLVSHEI